MQIYLVGETLETSNLKQIVLPSSSTISSWIIEYYFANFSSKTILGCSQMFEIYQKFHPMCDLEEFWSFSRKKLNREEANLIMNQYETYLNRCGLIDVIDIYHQCQLEVNFEKIFLTKSNIRNDIDRVIFQYWLDLPTIPVEIEQTEMKEEFLNLIETEQAKPENQLKNTICAYIALLFDTRNEYAFEHCLKNQSNYAGSSKEVVDFIESLRMLIKENEQTKIESIKTFRQIMESICQQFENNQSFHENLLEEFSCTFSSLSASSGDFLRLLAHFHAKQTIALPITKDIPRENQSIHRRQLKTIRKCRSLDLSIIYETSFDCESTLPMEFKPRSIPKRQPLREICINTFDSAQHEFENEDSIQLKLLSDDDKENIPMLTRKRSLVSTKSQTPSKKLKKLHVKPDLGQPMITNFFHSTN